MARNSAWGLDIGVASIKAARVSGGKGSLVLEEAEVIQLSDFGSESETSRDDLIFRAIRSFAERHDTKNADVYVSVPGSAAFSRVIALPPVEKKKIPDIIRYEARQQIPYSIEEVVWDYQPVREEFAPGEEVEVGLFAVKRDYIANLIGNLLPLREHLEGIQVASLALYNFIMADREGEGAVVVVDLGAQSTDLIVIEEGRFWLRNITVAGNTITEAIRKKFNLSFEDAENVKRKYAQSKHRREIFAAIHPVLKDLVAEIQRSLGYYKSLSRDVKIDQVLLTGEGVKLAGLRRYLAESLQYEIRELNEFKSIAVSGGVDADFLRESLPSLTVAIGLAAQGRGAGPMRVNLLPSDFLIEREATKVKPWGIAVAACLLLMVGLSYISAKRLNADLTGKVDLGRDVLERVKQKESEYQSAEDSINRSDLDYFLSLCRKRAFWLTFTETLANIIPENIYLRKMTSEKGPKDELEQKLETKAAGQQGGAPGAGMAGGGMMGMGMMGGGAMGPGAGGGEGGPGMGGMMGGGGMMGMGMMGTGQGASTGSEGASDERMLVTFVVETEHRDNPLKRIETDFVSRLKKLTLPGDKAPLFEKVKIVRTWEEERYPDGSPARGGTSAGVPAAGGAAGMMGMMGGMMRGAGIMGAKPQRGRYGVAKGAAADIQEPKPMMMETEKYLVVEVKCLTRSEEELRTGKASEKTEDVSSDEGIGIGP